MVNAKTPNKRKSFANAGAKSPQSPKKTKFNESMKTPNKKNNGTPAKGKTPRVENASDKTPQQRAPQNAAKTPKQTPGKGQQKGITAQNAAKSPKQTPGKGFAAQNAAKTPKKTPGKGQQKRASESENEASPQKLQKFTGTPKLEDFKKEKIESENEASPQQLTKKGQNKQTKAAKKKAFSSIREKISSGDKSVLEELEAKIKAIESRKASLTKTGKRKLRMLCKFKRTLLGEKPTLRAPSQKKQAQQQAKAKKTGANQKKAKPVPQVKKEEEEGDESSDYEVETEVQPDKTIKSELKLEESSDEDDDGEEEEESGSGEEDDDEEDEDDSEEEVEDNEGKKPKTKQAQSPNLDQLKETQIVTKGQSRYVLFVGNLPYDATKSEISEHFAKAGQVKHVRIPTDQKTDKPRGFAYVEFENEIAYQKGLSLHHTFIKGRRINVLYTQGGKKQSTGKKNDVKAKNFKLHAMRKQGQLAGSVKQNQKRSVRRNQKNFGKKPVNGS